MNPFIWERKYEIDSLAAVLKLQVLYAENMGETDPEFMHDDYFKMLRIILETLHVQ
jgi:uncharacterized protein